MHGFKVAFRISGQVVNSPSEELLSMLMLLYAEDLGLLAPGRSDLKTALEELERITREWSMAINYPKTEAMVFGLPAATTAAMIQVGSWRHHHVHHTAAGGSQLAVGRGADGRAPAAATQPPAGQPRTE